MLRDNDRRSRSRSPYHRQHSHRSRSPHAHHHRRHHHSSHHKHKPSPALDTSSYIPPSAVPPRPIILSFNAQPISKHDLRKYKPMFASYLDIQKGRVLEDLSEDEVKGRWKSFVGKWNRGELAAGWYDPTTLAKAVAAAAEEESYRALEREQEAAFPQAEEQARPQEQDAGADEDQDDDDDDEDLGPAPPPPAQNARGPAVPNRSDLTLRDEALSEADAASRSQLREERKADRALQKERLDELVPRAEAGTAERQREKRREKAELHASFAEARGAVDRMEEVPEGEAMGGGGGEEIREMKKREERRKNERELRREEMLRARQEEREERLSGLRAREEKTVEMLKALAKERFG